MTQSFYLFYQHTHTGQSIFTTTVPYHIWTWMRLLVCQINGRNGLLKTVILIIDVYLFNNVSQLKGYLCLSWLICVSSCHWRNFPDLRIPCPKIKKFHLFLKQPNGLPLSVCNQTNWRLHQAFFLPLSTHMCMELHVISKRKLKYFNAMEILER